MLTALKDRGMGPQGVEGSAWLSGLRMCKLFEEGSLKLRVRRGKLKTLGVHLRN